jgi:hypothetical protein
MYRRPKFLELLLEVRRDMAHEADYDVDLFAENVRHGSDVKQPKSMAEPNATNGQPANNKVKQDAELRPA